MLTAAQTLQDYIPLVMPTEELTAGFDAMRAQINEDETLSDEDKEASINAMTAEQATIVAARENLSTAEAEAITQILSYFPISEMSLIIDINDAVNETNTPEELGNVLTFNAKMELHRLVDSGLFGDIPQF